MINYTFVGENKSRDYYKGQSFRYCSDWSLDKHYEYSEFFTDFVRFKNCLLSCKKTHISAIANKPELIYDPINPERIIGINSEYWNLVIANGENNFGIIVENTLDSDSTTNALSAKQGKVLNNTKANKEEILFEKGTGANSVVQKGGGSTASGHLSHAEGDHTIARGYASHSEGGNIAEVSNDIASQAIGTFAHAEGGSTIARGIQSHAEGAKTIAMGQRAHAEGYKTNALGNLSHTEGYATKANIGAGASHAEGYYTITNNRGEYAGGNFNKSNKKSDTLGNSGNTAHSVGIGTGAATNLRKNAFEIMQNGDIYGYGIGGYDGTNPTSGTNDLKTVIDSKALAATTLAGYNISDAYTKEAADNKISQEIEPIARDVNGIKIYNYYYSEEDNSILLPAIDSTLTIISLNSKGLPDNAFKAVLKKNSKIDGHELIDSDIILYQTGLIDDITTEGKYFYDRVDFVEKTLEKHCSAIPLSNLGNFTQKGAYEWTSEYSRLAISLDAIKELFPTLKFVKGTRFKCEVSGFTVRVPSDINLFIEGFDSVGVTTRKEAINYLKNSSSLLVLGLEVPEIITLSSLGIKTLINYVKGSLINPKYITDFSGCAQIAYVSLTELVYSKDQADKKFALKNNTYTKDAIDNKILFEKGIGENSIVQKDGNNQAISEGAIAIGSNNIAGVKGWYYKTVDFTNNKIYLTDTQTTPIAGTGTIETFTSNFAVNNSLSIINKNKYDKQCKITAIEGNCITVDVLPFSNINQVTTLEHDDYSCFSIETPNAGQIDLGQNAVIIGDSCKAVKDAYAFGKSNEAYGNYAFVEGRGNKVGYGAHAEGKNTTASGQYSHTEGESTTASGIRSHAEGGTTEANGTYAHAEGHANVTNGQASHVEGHNNLAGDYSGPKNEDTTNIDGYFAHAEGNSTLAKGSASHAEGAATQALGRASHAEGRRNIAQNNYAHAEGFDTYAGSNPTNTNTSNGDTIGLFTHAEGHFTRAIGSAAHAEGKGTEAKNTAEHAEGAWNVSNSGSSAATKTRHSIGIGAAGTTAEPDKNRKNAFEVMQNGDIYIYGKGGYDGTNAGQSGVKTIQQILTDLGVQ